MKKDIRKKLTLNRESLRRLEEADLRRLEGGAAISNPCPYTLQVIACYSVRINTCYNCTV